MTFLDLVSERFSPNGSFTAKGALNALGRPDLALTQLLVREMGQNSWDARRDQRRVRFTIELTQATGERLRFLLEHIFHRVPPGLPLGDVLAQARQAHQLDLLIIADRGTVGLGGPTRADRPGTPLNFVEFLRNYGQADNQAGSGGTYGFGKTAAYLASGAQTICVYSRWIAPHGPESRFICSALGDMHGMLTGRHWWGRDVDGVAEPLLAADADRFADALGLDVMTGDETGTTIVVVAPRSEVGVSFRDSVLSAILWNFWPKIIRHGDHEPAMEFRMVEEGRDVAIPDPRTTPPLSAYVQAFELATGVLSPTSPESTTVETITNERPKRRLGQLALVRAPALPSSLRRLPNPLGGTSHHVALMRMPNLVVKYLPGPALDTEVAEYAGVFKVDDGVESIFARAETPTHDNWSRDALVDANDRRAVNVALRKVDEAAKRFAMPMIGSAKGESEPLGRFATDLGVLMLGSGGSGPDGSRDSRRKPRASEPKPPRRSRAEVRATAASLPRQVGNALVATVGFTVLGSPDGRPCRVHGRVAAIVDEGELESDLPAGEAPLAIRRWIAPDGTWTTDAYIELPPGDHPGWSVEVDAAPDAQVGVELIAEAL